jgi:hypothetical protein
MLVSLYLFKLSCLSVLEYIFCTVLHRECRHLIKGALLLIDFILRTLIGTKTTVPASIAERDSTFESIFLEGLSRLMTGSLPGLKAMFQRRNEGRDAHALGKGHTSEGVGSASDSTHLWQKAAGMRRKNKQGLCANTNKRNSY